MKSGEHHDGYKDTRTDPVDRVTVLDQVSDLLAEEDLISLSFNCCEIGELKKNVPNYMANSKRVPHHAITKEQLWKVDN
ncbi:hypothetical protein J6590_060697 [Homalodisca vitripennis]|nr:hypothetical protein J6590_060697 [Homalodisca vitripennis]